MEFKNNKAWGTAEKLPNCIMRFTVNLSKEEANEIQHQAVRTINKEVSIHGFRKGKAPENLIAKQYGKHVDQEFRDIAIKAACREAIDATKAYPLKKDVGIEFEKFTPQEDGTVQIIFRYEVFPEVPDVKIDQIKIDPVEVKPISQDEIDRSIRELQLYHAKFEKVDRPAEENDFVIIDIDVIDEPPFKAYEKSRFQITEKGMPGWARKLVLGLKIGESHEGMSEKDSDSKEENFVPRKCRITVIDIQSGNLPSLDDELAKKAGVGTAEELKNKIEERIRKGHEMDQKISIRNNLKEILKKDYVFDLPAADLKNLNEDCKRMVEQDGHQFGSTEDKKAYLEKLFENGKGIMRLAYLIPHAATQLKLPMPKEEEINSRMIQILTQYYMETGEQVPESEFPKIKGNCQRELIHERVLDALIEKSLTPRE